MILDTSAVLAILLQEPESEAFRAAIIRAGTVLLSAGTCIELAAVAGRSATLRHDVESFLRQPYVRIEPVTASQAAMAGKAFRAWGKGHHPATLNLGDVFTYLLARERDLPLLFKGNDFSRTDIRAALPPGAP